MTANAHARTDWLAYALAPACLVYTLICRWRSERAQRREREALEAAMRAHGMTPEARRRTIAVLSLANLPIGRRSASRKPHGSLAVVPDRLELR